MNQKREGENLIRKQIMLFAEHIDYVKDCSKKTGMSESECVRRIIDIFVKKHVQSELLKEDK